VETDRVVEGWVIRRGAVGIQSGGERSDTDPAYPLSPIGRFTEFLKKVTRASNVRAVSFDLATADRARRN